MRRPLLTSRLRSEREGGRSQPDGGENGRSSASPSANFEEKRLREDVPRGGDVFARARVCPMILVFAGCSPGPWLTRTISLKLITNSETSVAGVKSSVRLSTTFRLD